MENERPTPLVDDIEGTRRKLESWLSAQQAREITIAGINIPEGTGMSNVTLLFDISYEDTLARWEQASGFSGRDYNYYLIFAGMRYGLILSRIMLATGQESEVQGNFACQLLHKHMERIS